MDLGGRVLEFLSIDHCCNMANVSRRFRVFARCSLSRPRVVSLDYPYSLQKFLKKISICNKVLRVSDSEYPEELVEFTLNSGRFPKLNIMPMQSFLDTCCALTIEQFSFRVWADMWEDLMKVIPNENPFPNVTHVVFSCNSLTPAMVAFLRTFQSLESIIFRMTLTTTMSPLPEDSTFEGLPTRISISIAIANVVRHTDKTRADLVRIVEKIPQTTIWLVILRGLDIHHLRGLPWPNASDTINIVEDKLRVRFPNMAWHISEPSLRSCTTIYFRLQKWFSLSVVLHCPSKVHQNFAHDTSQSNISTSTEPLSTTRYAKIEFDKAPYKSYL